MLEIICIEWDLENFFPPTFLDFIIHWPIHLVYEIKLWSPNYLHWMYSVEREIWHLQELFHNQNKIEALIVVIFLAVEYLIFCLRYLVNRVKTKFNRYPTDDDEDIQIEEADFSHSFCKIDHPIRGKKNREPKSFGLDNQQWVELHWYALFNTGDE